MRKRTISDPLRKRLLRELKTDFGKYFVIFAFLVITIGFVSGVYVANGGMLKTSKESFSRYRIESGHFALDHAADDGLLSTLRNQRIRLYPDFYKMLSEKNGRRKGRVRVYAVRHRVNKADVMAGRLPKKTDEIAIDRMHANNNGIAVGDHIRIGGRKMKVTGLVAHSDYSALFENNTNPMFDAINFDVAVVTAETFDALPQSTHYNYAWIYRGAPKNDNKEKVRADKLMNTIAKEAALSGNRLTDFVPRYLNQAINFTIDDMGGDRTMAGIMLDILVVVLAFIFAVTISNTVTKESATIGTLRASGYSRGELLRHYLTMPLIVTLVAAAVGNVLGYTLFKNVVEGMYYNSYSLPTFVPLISSDAFVMTTVVPIILMMLINVAVLAQKLSFSPLAFLRGDLTRKQKKRAIRLPRIRFIRRFRLRIILQNLPGYLVLVLGITFVMLLLYFATGFPSTLRHYQQEATETMIADYQTILKATVPTATKGAEPFSMTELETVSGVHKGETITVYGIASHSHYVSAIGRLKSHEVYLSEGFRKKFGYRKGDRVTLSAKYEHKRYHFEVAGFAKGANTMAVFMPNRRFNTVFGYDTNHFNGYFSNRKVKDIDSRLIATTIDRGDVTKISRQLNHSMGNYMRYFQYACVVAAALLIYLLTKLIIERNTNAISMVKILGYKDREIASLYLIATTWVIVLAELIGLLVAGLLIRLIWVAYINTMDGWFSFYMPPSAQIKMFIAVFAGYAAVTVLDFRRIRKIPMDTALKNME
ncbi:ABC transporter permease [Pseudoramibacter faecis]|uniref:ABC transporter permease n=1 Tax=Pseudoramibacter faecis TaxID=3108534 RepID=UPI002E7A5C3E|nr:ABC transporter permease [Pseudoramibacter sp. HA2172]